MPLSTKKTTPNIKYGTTNLDPLPEPPEQKTDTSEKTMSADDFLNLFEKVKEDKKEP